MMTSEHILKEVLEQSTIRSHAVTGRAPTVPLH